MVKAIEDRRGVGYDGEGDRGEEWDMMVKAIEDRRGVGYDGEGDRGEERGGI